MFILYGIIVFETGVFLAFGDSLYSDFVVEREEMGAEDVNASISLPPNRTNYGFFRIKSGHVRKL